MLATTFRTAEVEGVRIFYREAGPPDAPALLLLHGFPTSSHMFRDLIPLLADRFHLVAPDLPGFGFSDAPDRARFSYTFAHLAQVMGRFTDVIGLSRFAIYVFDYGAPVGFRLAMSQPRPDYRDRLAERKRLRSRFKRGVEPDPRLLARAERGQPPGASRVPVAGIDALAVRARRAGRVAGRARELHARLGTAGPARER